mgnify:CR=1 FL=1
MFIIWTGANCHTFNDWNQLYWILSLLCIFICFGNLNFFVFRNCIFLTWMCDIIFFVGNKAYWRLFINFLTLNLFLLLVKNFHKRNSFFGWYFHYISEGTFHIRQIIFVKHTHLISFLFVIFDFFKFWNGSACSRLHLLQMRFLLKK